MAADWFALMDGDEVGPLVDAELRRLAGSGKLQPFSSVRRGDQANWTLAKNVRGLFPSTQSVSLDHEASPAVPNSRLANLLEPINVSTNVPQGNILVPPTRTKLPLKWLLVAACILTALTAAVIITVMLVTSTSTSKTPFQLQMDEFTAQCHRLIQMFDRLTNHERLEEQLAKAEPELLDLVPLTDNDRQRQRLAEELYQSLSWQIIRWRAATTRRLSDDTYRKNIREFEIASKKTNELFHQLTTEI